jgi:hypothetical protein
MGTWNDIAPYYNLINVRSTNIFEDSFKRRQISVNIIERSDTHTVPFGFENIPGFLILSFFFFHVRCIA